MVAEAVNGIPLSATVPGLSDIRPVLERIAVTCVKHLRLGGYLSEAEAALLTSSYRESICRPSPPQDALIFIAETQAEKHSLTVEGEVLRMQKILRASLSDRVHYWSFGPLPGRADALYEHCPALRPICGALGCPAIMAGETSIVHVASINPVAATVASFWIGHELNRVTAGDSPFVFSFLTDLASWSQLMQRHFA
ncbi:MAG TPA: hypothetical protein DIT64_15380 [Verrucomicrobiales bacterium]|nr:hypothetical protein [Verrucomicrobiales bacterium]HCN78494.1 hypothetical protein [Verrucomicrobiales bacterium]HRJ06969.1 hypothetical protein [Prosthecobacter sp.]HRK13077.1 hypothetical protein [Prosthecobacter sp.]